MKTPRPLALTLAAVLLVLISLGSLATPLLGGPPVVVKVLSVAMGLLGFVAAYGLWNKKRWGMVVAILVSTLNALSGVPGLFVQPNLPAALAAAVGIALSILIIVLTVLPSARTAYA